MGRDTIVLLHASVWAVNDCGDVDVSRGAKYDHGAAHYLFFQNFFSDLGATQTQSGKSNLPSEVLFVVALCAVGLGMVGSSSSWKVIAGNNCVGAGWGVTAQVFSLLSGACFIGVGVTPWNLVLAAHNAFVKAAFLLLMGFLISITMLQVRNGWPGRYTICDWIYLVLLAAYLYILLHGPRLDTERGLAIQVAAQKIIVYASILNLGHQALGIRRGALEASKKNEELRAAPVNRSSLLSR